MSSTTVSLPAWTTELEDQASELFAFDSLNWPRDPKIIHDAVWGSRVFAAWEIAIIDLPVVQRLRGIRQLSMSFLVYPTAVHTRFEHSLGVASAAKEMLRETGLASGSDSALEASDNVVAAALLHDIGHGPFSHLSEEMYFTQTGWMTGVTEPARGALFPRAQPHEAIGALLLRTTAADDFFQELNSKFGTNIDGHMLGDFITGNAVEGKNAYASIVNGSTDADKLDYLRRDSFFSGIPLSLDVNRLLYALSADEDSLTVGAKGVVPAEQITFAKATLTSALYHHRKVRASDCAFKGFADRLIRIGAKFGNHVIRSPADMLKFTDADFLSFAVSSDESKCNELISAIRLRHLPVSVRELRFSQIDDESASADKFASMDVLRFRPAGQAEEHYAYERQRSLAADLWAAIGDSSIPAEQIWVDIPPKPKIGGVEVNVDGLGSAQTFPSNEWTRLYGQYKYKGHIFVPRRAAERAKKVVNDVLHEYSAVLGVDIDD